MDNKETGCQPLEGPILCSNNCGFFGSATTMNLCSRCYREVLAKQAKESEAAAAISAIHAKASQDVKVISATVETSAKESEATELPAPPPPPVICLPESTAANISTSSQQLQKPNRCFCCNKRVGLTGFKCKCGGLFCSVHRYNDKHNCTFDYKAAARDAILKANPVIKADKINKI